MTDASVISSVSRRASTSCRCRARTRSAASSSRCRHSSGRFTATAVGMPMRPPHRRLRQGQVQHLQRQLAGRARRLHPGQCLDTGDAAVHQPRLGLEHQLGHRASRTRPGPGPRPAAAPRPRAATALPRRRRRRAPGPRRSWPPRAGASLRPAPATPGRGPAGMPRLPLRPRSAPAPRARARRPRAGPASRTRPRRPVAVPPGAATRPRPSPRACAGASRGRGRRPSAGRRSRRRRACPPRPGSARGGWAGRSDGRSWTAPGHGRAAPVKHPSGSGPRRTGLVKIRRTGSPPSGP